MTPVEKVHASAARNGGITVGLEFLRADGTVEKRLKDLVAVDFLLNEKAFVYYGVDDDRVHAHRIRHITEAGDDVILDTDQDDLRLVLGLVVWPEEIAAVEGFVRSEPLAEEMKRFFDAM